MAYEGLDFTKSAYLYWPVEWIDRKRPKPVMEHDLHVTAIYMPHVGVLEKDELLDVIRKGNRRENGYEVAKVIGPDAFGPLNDHPVLLLDMNNYWERRDLEHILDAAGFGWSNNWPFTPHVTVDLPTVLNPPKKVLLRPLMLGWKDDEPVVV